MPNKITHQKLNDYIKEVGKIALINDEIKIERKRAGKNEISFVPKHDLIMGHTARRTFCTIKYKDRVSVEDIMVLSGHTTIKEFMKYIRITQEEKVAQIVSTEAFKNSSKLT